MHWGVVSGNGTDTIIITDVTPFRPAYLCIEMGNDQKTESDISCGTDERCRADANQAGFDSNRGAKSLCWVLGVASNYLA